MNKKSLNETEIRTKYITPATKKAGWGVMQQISEEKYFTDGKIFVRGQMVSKGKGKKADYLLYYEPNILLAVVEAKDNKHEIDGGLQQGLGYAEILDAPGGSIPSIGRQPTNHSKMLRGQYESRPCSNLKKGGHALQFELQPLSKESRRGRRVHEASDSTRSSRQKHSRHPATMRRESDRVETQFPSINREQHYHIRILLDALTYL